MPHVHHHLLARWLCGLIALAGCVPTTSTPEPDTPPVLAQRFDPQSDECVAPGCGNGVLEAYEACDDGNTQGGDGCSATCLQEQAEPKPAGVIRLQNRAISPAKAIDPALVAAAAEAEQPYLHAMAVFDERPESDAPAAWAEAGIALAGYIHADVYIVKLPLTETADGEPMDEAGFEALRVRLGAKHLVAFAAGDRADEATQAGDLPDWAVDPATGLARVLVLVYGGVPANDRDALIEAIQAGDEPAVLASEALVAVTTPVEALPALLASPLVEWIEPGPHPADELMDAVRANLGVTNADRPSLCLTGAGVRLATVGETAQANHPDFYTYDVNGVQGASRLLAGAAGGGAHGTHVIGIMAGNGWLSQAQGGQPFQWRGVAPEAQVTDAKWYTASPTGARPHAAGSSTVPIGFDGFYDAGLMDMDARIRGDAHLGHFFTQLWAAGNNGGGYAGGATGQGSGSGTRGNYAVVATGKNTVSVANIFAEDFRWASSSMGPSHDGRIKPEVAAPGCRLRHPYQDVAFEVEYLRVVRPTPGDADLNYDFEGPTMDGWYPWQMWREKATGPTKVASPGGHAARFMLTGPRPLLQWSKYEVAAGERTIHDYFNGTYGGLSKANDEIHLRYRYAGGEPLFEGGHILLWWFWNLTDANAANDQVRYLEVPIRADGAWDTIVLPASALGDWAGHPIDTLRLSPGAPNPGAIIAAGETSQYAGMCGTSMASPAATGVVGLLLEELATTRGVDLDDPLSPSPFAWGSPGTGRPLPSTFRALLVHSARDLARVARIGDTNGADTGEPPSYHKGPDFTMGYGAVDAEEAVRVLQDNAAGNLPIYERQAAPATTQVFNLTVPPNQRAPLKVTLAWSDPGISPTGLQHEKKLVNDLDLELRAPSGAIHRPWSIDLPYIPYSCPTCLPPQAVGDEPVTTADFVPARNDLKNGRDNLEMVYVETPEAGVWQVRVSVPPLPTGPQKYSIILGQPAPPADELAGGKVAFVSDRGGIPAVYVSHNDGNPPVALPSMGAPARDPEWSPDGRYVAYVAWETVSGADQLIVWDTLGTNHHLITTPFPGYRYLSHPSWAPDGSEIFIGYHDDPQEKAIGAVAFPSATTRTLYATPPGGFWSPDAPVYAGVDPTGRAHVLVHATGACVENALFRLPVEGGELDRVWADGFPSTRALFPSATRDGRRILFTSEDHLVGTPGFDDYEVVEVGALEGVTTRHTNDPGPQIAAYAIGGVGEWAAETNAPGGRRDIILQHNGVRQALAIADPGNAYDDYHPSWWKADPSVPVPDPNAPTIACPATVLWPPQVAPCGPRTPPPATATSVCGGPVQIDVDPPTVSGGGSHTVTYTATDRLGHQASCTTVISWQCISSN